MENKENIEDLSANELVDRLQSELDAQGNGSRRSLQGRKSVARKSLGPQEGRKSLFNQSGRRKSQAGRRSLHAPPELENSSGPSAGGTCGPAEGRIRSRSFGPSHEQEMQTNDDGADVMSLASDVNPQTFKQLLHDLEAQYDSDIAALQANCDRLEGEVRAIKASIESNSSFVSAPDADAPALQNPPVERISSSSGETEKQTSAADAAFMLAQLPKNTHTYDVASRRRHGRLRRLRTLLQSTSFEMGIGLLILANVIVMAFDMQYKGFDAGHALKFSGMDQSAAQRWPMAKEIISVLDVLFTLAFSVELIARILAFGPKFFLGLFNWLDFVVVSLSAMEVIAVSLPGNTTVLRLVRLGKLARGLRLIRMSKVLDSLHLLLKCIAASVSMLLWSLLLLAVIQCTAGMLIGQLVAGYIEDNNNAAIESLETRQSIFRYYGTFSFTMLTMFEVLFANWTIPCRLLVDHVNEWYMMYFIIYRCLVGFCVLNVVSAVFVQQTMRVAAEDQDLFVQQKMRATEKYTKKLKHVFNLLDTTGDGVIEEEEFMELLNTPTMAYFMAQLELESTDFLSLFKLMDVDDSGEVTVEEFMEGCKRLKGTAKSVDLALVLAHTARMNSKLDNLLGCQDQFGWGYGAAGSVDVAKRFSVASNFSAMSTGSLTGTLGEGAKQKLAPAPQTINESDEDAESEMETVSPIKDAKNFGVGNVTSIIPGSVGAGTAMRS